MLKVTAVFVCALSTGCARPAEKTRETMPSAPKSSESTVALCRTGKQVELRTSGEVVAPDGTNNVFQVTQDGLDLFPLGAAKVWSADLNGDGADDLALRVADSCGSGGCEYAVYLNCGDSRYVTVVEPTYAGDLRVGEGVMQFGSGEEWRNLQDEHKVAYRGKDGGTHERLEVSVLKFDGRAYRRPP
jgi:hypothetical protein